MTDVQARWLGQGYRTAAKVSFAVGGVGFVIATAARSGLGFLVFALAPLVIGTVLFVLSSVARREQIRHWSAYTAGASYQRPSPIVKAVTIGLGLLVPPAVFLTLRIPIGCSVLNFLTLPWPSEIQIPVQIACLAVATAGMALVFGGMSVPHMQSVSSAVVMMWAFVSPVVFIIFFFSVYGDPDPTTCRP